MLRPYKKGHIPWNKGLKGVHFSPETEFKKGHIPAHAGRKRPEHAGKKHWHWQGGWRNRLPKCPVCGKTLSRLNGKGCQQHPFNKRENHYEWKGDNVGYFALHDWVYKEKGKPQKCEHCGEKEKRLYWTNKSHTYKRNVNDWISLCASCHRRYDGYVKIDSQKANEINALYATGKFTQIELGRKYGVNRVTIAKYLK